MKPGTLILIAVTGAATFCALSTTIALFAMRGQRPAEMPLQLPPKEPVEPVSPLVGFWDHGAEKYALHETGLARKWLRYSWDGSAGAAGCKSNGDFFGSWSLEGNQLAIELTSGKWRDCRGEQPFEPFIEKFTFRFDENQARGVKVLWLQTEQGKAGFDLECKDPVGCAREPDPL